MKPNRQDRPLSAHEEMALVKLQALFKNALKGSGLSKSKLSRQLGVSESFISLLTREGRGCTFLTMVRFLGACGYDLELGLRPSALGILKQEKLQ